MFMLLSRFSMKMPWYESMVFTECLGSVNHGDLTWAKTYENSMESHGVQKTVMPFQ